MRKKKIKRIGVFTSGGDAPGMNAAVRAVVRTGIYHKLEVFGIFHGYSGMINGEISKLGKPDVANIIHRGGTLLKTSRSEDFRTPKGRKAAYALLKKHKIDACVAIGGNGTYTGAKVFTEEHDIPFIGVPGTIDNDIYGSDFTIGFDTAINTAIEAIDRVRDTADSHNRLFFIEVMGRHAGYIALNTGIGSGAAFTLIPETKTPITDIVAFLEDSAKRNKLFNLIIVAEGNKNGNATKLSKKLKKVNKKLDSRVLILGHLQRGGAPSASDRVLASRLGYEAVNGLVKGAQNMAVGIINEEVIFTEFEHAIQKSKVIKPDLVEMSKILAL